MWFDYQRERIPGFRVLEKPYGFATYSYLDVKGAKGIYIEDIYIKPHMRQEGLASKLSEEIQELSKKDGVKYLLGTVAVDSTSPTDSLKVLLAHGMSLLESNNEIIWMYKDL